MLKYKVDPPGIDEPAPLSPYPNFEGMISCLASPTRISNTIKSHPLITWLTPAEFKRLITKWALGTIDLLCIRVDFWKSIEIQCVLSAHLLRSYWFRGVHISRRRCHLVLNSTICCLKSIIRPSWKCRRDES